MGVDEAAVLAARAVMPAERGANATQRSGGRQ